MTEISNILFKQNRDNPSIVYIIFWWELRRIVFNMLIAISGIFVLFSNGIIDSSLGYTGIDDPNFIIIVYAMMANICYTGGEILQIVVRIVRKDKSKQLGEITFKWGLLFSISLTLLPGISYFVFNIFK